MIFFLCHELHMQYNEFSHVIPRCILRSLFSSKLSDKKRQRNTECFEQYMYGNCWNEYRSCTSIIWWASYTFLFMITNIPQISLFDQHSKSHSASDPFPKITKMQRLSIGPLYTLGYGCPFHVVICLPIWAVGDLLLQSLVLALFSLVRYTADLIPAMYVR